MQIGSRAEIEHAVLKIAAARGRHHGFAAVGARSDALRE